MIFVYGHGTKREELPTKFERPEAAKSHWQGIAHRELADTVVDEIKMQGWEPGEEQYALAAKGRRIVGAVDVTIPDLSNPDGIKLGVGFMAGNDRRQALKLFVGGTVTLCTNGLTTGEVVLRRKHSTGIDLAEELEQGLERYRQAAEVIPATVARLKDQTVSASEVIDYLNEAEKRDLMAHRYLWDVANEYYNPTHTEHGVPDAQKGTAWSLLNAFTETVKKCPAHRQMQQIEGFRQLITAA